MRCVADAQERSREEANSVLCSVSLGESQSQNSAVRTTKNVSAVEMVLKLLSNHVKSVKKEPF